MSCAEVTEVPYLAFTSQRTPIPGRLIVPRVPERNTRKLADAAQQGLFNVWRYHAIFTNNPGSLIAAESQAPRARDHRAGHRRPQGRTPGTPALRALPGQRRLAGRGHDRVQPDPRDRGGRRWEIHQSRGRDRARQDHQHSRAGVPLRAKATAAPTPAMAMATALAEPLDHGHDQLSRTPPAPTNRGTWTSRTDRQDDHAQTPEPRHRDPDIDHRASSTISPAD